MADAMAEVAPHPQKLALEIRRVLATDYGNWPETVKRASVAPVVERPVSPAELRDFLNGRHQSWEPWIAKGLDVPLFAKIGVCSWQEWPWLFPYVSDLPVNLSAFCSARMRVVLNAWLLADTVAYLRFFPYVNYSHVNEYRFSIGSFNLARSVIRHGHDGAGHARELLEKQSSDLPCGTIDIATRIQDGKILSWVIELNP